MGGGGLVIASTCCPRLLACGQHDPCPDFGQWVWEHIQKPMAHWAEMESQTGNGAHETAGLLAQGVSKRAICCAPRPGISLGLCITEGWSRCPAPRSVCPPRLPTSS